MCLDMCCMSWPNRCLLLFFLPCCHGFKFLNDGVDVSNRFWLSSSVCWCSDSWTMYMDILFMSFCLQVSTVYVHVGASIHLYIDYIAGLSLSLCNYFQTFHFHDVGLLSTKRMNKTYQHMVKKNYHGFSSFKFWSFKFCSSWFLIQKWLFFLSKNRKRSKAHRTSGVSSGGGGGTGASSGGASEGGSGTPPRRWNKSQVFNRA